MDPNSNTSKSRRGVPIKVWLPDEYYIILREIAEKEGYETVPDLIISILSSYIKGSLRLPPTEDKKSAEFIARRLERTVQDLLNPFTGKLDEIYRRLATIQELLEEIGKQEMIARREEEQIKKPISRAAQAERASIARKGTSAIDRLREEGVVFQEDLKWLRAPDKFFQKLQREGAIVIELNGERIAIDNRFWEEFTAILPQIYVRDPEEASGLIESSMGKSVARRLFMKLLSAGYIYYDETLGHWRLSSILEERS